MSQSGYHAKILLGSGESRPGAGGLNPTSENSRSIWCGAVLRAAKRHTPMVGFAS